MFSGDAEAYPEHFKIYFEHKMELFEAKSSILGARQGVHLNSQPSDLCLHAFYIE